MRTARGWPIENCDCSARRRRVVRLDDELRSLVTERIDVAPHFLVVADRNDLDVEQVVGTRLARPELDQPTDLGAGDQRALRANRLRRVDREIEHVAAAEQPFRAVHVEDDARIGLRAHRKRDARRNVRLDQTGDDVHRRALRRDDEMDSGCARRAARDA